MRLVQRLRSLVDVHVRGLLTLRAQVQDAKILAAKALIAQTAGMGMLDDIRAAEFKVFSQFGEDGIIQYLIRQARIPERSRGMPSAASSIHSSGYPSGSSSLNEPAGSGMK